MNYYSRIQYNLFIFILLLHSICEVKFLYLLMSWLQFSIKKV